MMSLLFTCQDCGGETWQCLGRIDPPTGDGQAVIEKIECDDCGNVEQVSA